VAILNDLPPEPLNLTPKRSPKRHPLKEHRDDCYESAPEAVHALLRVEDLPQVILEPCCGSGAIVKVLRATGRTVHAYDLIDYGLEDSLSRVDFLMEWKVLPGTEMIVTNPPNKLATEFAEHALQLCPRLILLQPLTFCSSEERGPIMDNGILQRIHAFKRRLPMMHRRGWTGPKNTSQTVYAWFVFDRDYRGPTIFDRIDWKA
jgi:hypothetical protein